MTRLLLPLLLLLVLFLVGCSAEEKTADVKENIAEGVEAGNAAEVENVAEEAVDTEANTKTTEEATESIAEKAAEDPVRWEPRDNTWRSYGNVPDCGDVVLETPTDLSKVTSILYPGQVRGNDFKPHGGFRLDESGNGEVTVVAAMDGYVYRAAHYNAASKSQYMFDIINECGLMQRFDHLTELSPKLAALASQIPAMQEEDSRTSVFPERVYVEKGEVIATAVGMPGNIFFDFGFYDLREENGAEISAAYQGTFARYGLCWFSLLSEEDEAVVRSLPPADGVSGSESDYC